MSRTYIAMNGTYITKSGTFITITMNQTYLQRMEHT